MYDILLDWDKQTVIFYEAGTIPPDPIKMPEKLYLVDYSTTYDVFAEADANGVFKFHDIYIKGEETISFGADKNEQICKYLIYPWSYTENTANLVPESGMQYDWIFDETDAHSYPIQYGVGAFKPEKGYYDIELDWNSQKVKFTKVSPPNLWLVGYSYHSDPVARGENNIYYFEKVVPGSSWADYCFADNQSSDVASILLSARAATDPNTTTLAPEMGVDYPLYYTNWTRLNSTQGTFDLVNGTAYNITLDWDSMTVRFDMPDPDEPQTLYISDTSTSYGSATNDGNGKFLFKGANLHGTGYYGFTGVNTHDNMPGWVISATKYSSDAQNVTPVYGETYSWTFGTFSNISNYKGAFELLNGQYDIELDWRARTVSFKPTAPDHLYIVNISNSFGSAEIDDNGKYVFKGVTLADDAPYYGFSATKVTNTNSADWVLGPWNYAVNPSNLVPEMDQEYPLVRTIGSTSVFDYKGTFNLPAGVYDVIVDWDAQSVVFKPGVPHELYFCWYNNAVGYSAENPENTAHAVPDADGVFKFEDVDIEYISRYLNSPYFGFSPVRLPNNAVYIIAADMTGISGSNVLVEIDTPHKFQMYTGDNCNVMNRDEKSFVVYPSLYDVTLDWNAGTVVFSQKDKEAPAQLWIGRDAFSRGSAVNDGNGIFKFQGVKMTNNGSPYYGFYDTEKDHADATIVIGATVNGDNVTVRKGNTYSWNYTLHQMITTKKMCSFEVPEDEYDIILDWNNKTVTFSDPGLPEAPAKLWVVDYSTTFGEPAVNDGNGIFKFKDVLVDDTSWPYYGFANSASVGSASLVLSAVPLVDAPNANNVVVEAGTVYPFYRSSQSVINGEKGTFMLPMGWYDITLDYNNQTVVFASATHTEIENVTDYADYNLPRTLAFDSETNPEWIILQVNGNEVYAYDRTDPEPNHSDHVAKLLLSYRDANMVPGAVIKGLEAVLKADDNNMRVLQVMDYAIEEVNNIDINDYAVEVRHDKEDGNPADALDELSDHQIVTLKGIHVQDMVSVADAHTPFVGAFYKADGTADKYIRFEFAGPFAEDYSFGNAVYDIVGAVGHSVTTPQAAPAREGAAIPFTTKTIYSHSMSKDDTLTSIKQVFMNNYDDYEWYTLQGVKVMRPTPGNVYIRVAGGVATKVLVIK